MKDDFNLQQGGRMEAPSNAVAEEVSWAWKRKALQRCKAGINLYVRFNIIDDIKRELGIIDAGVYQEFTNSCFGHFLQFHWEGYNNAALHALIAQEITKPDAPSDEIWFRIGEQCIRFSKYEYALVTGLRFGNSTFDPNAPHDPPKGGVYGRLFQREGRLVLDDLRDRFTHGQFRQSAVDALKVAKVLFVYYMLFGLDGRQTSVERWVWALVEDLEQWESFPWGKYTFQILVHYIQGLPVRLRLPHPERRRPPSYHFYGCSFALLIWGCEAIPLLGSTCGSRVSADQQPRCLRWTFRKMSVDMTDFFFNQMVCFETLESSIDEQQQIYWQHLDDDLCSGIQYVHRDNRFKRLTNTTANTAALAQRPWTSRTAVTASAASIAAQMCQTLRSCAISATPISSRRPRKRQRLDLSDRDGRDKSQRPNSEARRDPLVSRHHDHTGVVCDSSMLTFIREEVGLMEKRIPEIIREELRHLFPYMGMSQEKLAQNEDDRCNFFYVPIDPLTTNAGHVPASDVTPVANKNATSVPPPDSPVTSGADTSTTSTQPPDVSLPPISDSLDHRPLETDASKAYGDEFVGCKVKVCRPKSKTFSEGAAASCNQSHKKQLEQPFDLKIRSTSPILLKDQRMENMEAGITPIDSVLQSTQVDEGVHNVNGYKVRTNAALTLDAVFNKYGDIAARCIYKSISVRASLLEVVCNVVQRLQHDNIDTILSNLEVIENELSDVEASKIEVSWLREHLAKLRKIVPFREKSIELRKTKAKSDTIIKAAANELKERHAELQLAQKRFEEAEKCANALRLVGRNIEDDIVESESEEYFWRRRLDDLL